MCDRGRLGLNNRAHLTSVLPRHAPRSRGIFLVPRSHHLAARCASDRGQPASARGVGCRCSRLLPLPIGLLLRKHAGAQSGRYQGEDYPDHHTIRFPAHERFIPSFDVGPILAQLVVFSPNDLFDDRLCDLIPMLCPAAVTNPDGDFATTKDIALIGPLAETDRLIVSSHAATLAKIAALHVVCVGHGPHRSSTPHLQRPTSVSRPCVNYFTQLAQIRHAVVWTPSFGAGPQIGGPLSGQTRLRCPREPTSIQNDSGLLRPIHVCPMDLAIRSVAG